MARKIGIFIDIENLYYCLNKKFGYGHRLDYGSYYDYVKGFGEIQQATAYGSQEPEQAKKFIMYLRHTGFHTKYRSFEKRKVNWGCGITVDLVESLNSFDMIVLGMSDPNFDCLVNWAQSKGVDVVVLACGICKELKITASKCIEIPESMLESRDDGSREA